MADSSIFECFAKIIDKYNYIENEIIKTIAITQSIGNSNIKGFVQDDLLLFNINYGINTMNFYSNIYCKIIGENYDIDYLSYNGLINDESKGSELPTSDNSTLIIIIIAITAFIILIVIICLIYLIYQNKRQRALLREIMAAQFHNSNEDDI